MKKILESKFILVVTVVLLTLTVDVIADTILKSESISYSNNKTTETTVNGALDELFESVEINERLGTTDISGIGNGTVTGALNEINNNFISYDLSIPAFLVNSNVTVHKAYIQKVGNLSIFHAYITTNAEIPIWTQIFANLGAPIRSIGLSDSRLIFDNSRQYKLQFSPVGYIQTAAAIPSGTVLIFDYII